ncbi:MAG: hypothetical protein H6757_06360 [Candidatus Omnitrophica bacterium]|nr:hypothetical protein [Candidatus Omnitrophota bacterium]
MDKKKLRPGPCSVKYLFLFLAMTVLIGCGAEPGPIGDGTFLGKISKGRVDDTRSGKQVLRITQNWKPIPLEMTIEPTRRNTSSTGQWVRVGDEIRVVPPVTYKGQTQEIHRSGRIYLIHYEDGRTYEAFIDGRYDRRKSERFLKSLQIKPLPKEKKK